MSHRKAASSSKFGHLFGDTSDSSSTSSQGRLSGSGDLYRDPLAALVPPVTATTTTTRGGATAVKATLSPPPSTTSASAAASAATSSRNSPPGSGPNSRSSSRLQHNVLFSSLTSNDAAGSSLFDSIAPASSTLSAAKRDLLFGEGTSISGGSGRRTSTPPLSKNNSSSISSTASSSQQSSRVSTPPIVNTRLTTALDAEASPLGLPPLNNSFSSGSRLQGNEDDVLSIKSPLSTGTEPLTRTSSQASTKSHESVKSSRSIQSQDTIEDTKRTASVKPILTGASAFTSGSAGPTSPSSARSPRVKGSITTVDHIFNPLTSKQPQHTENILSKSTAGSPITHQSIETLSRSTPGSSTTPQSIETFQAISRSSSPITSSANVIIPPIPVSKSGFERENDNSSPPPISKSKIPVNVSILDDATEAFAKDLLFSPGPIETTVVNTGTLRSSSFLDSGFSSSRIDTTNTAGGSAESMAATAIDARVSIVNPGVGASTVGQTKSLSGFSLGEDVADSSNPWMNTLVDSLNQTDLGGSASSKTIYAPPDVSEANFMSEAAFSLHSSATVNAGTTTKGTKSTSLSRSTLAPIPSLEEDVGGFNDVFSSMQSDRSTSATTLSISSPLPPELAPSPSLSQPLTRSSNWNVLDAAEAAAMDPDFMGPSALVNQSTDKVLAMMQMPKIALDKDVSAQEVFDNPWE
ncbi:hypothetical protein BGX21_010149 [Mortierella sp. AD011]|nr:hypothetical protein BGX20_010435 [Mortierella sp. AD010]KAF9394962.1 hypothetical protein BGX21_010149 [Mortierella sp. AD011]